MTDFTRRTHVVRIYDTPPATGEAPSGTYIDIEVLDAIAYRTTEGKEAILNFAGGEIEPYIVDNTGDNQGKTPDASIATRRSHMQRITSKDGTSFFDAEVLDCVAFRDENGLEWIMDFPNEDGSVNEFNTTTGQGDETSTRRVHNEKVSSDLTDKAPTQYVTSVRTDAISFRTIMGQEMILKMPSGDDPNGPIPRASTVLTPPSYTPNNSDPDATAPPTNSDKNVYAFMPSGGGDFFTGDTPVDMGPLWWIRNVNGGSQKYLLLFSGLAPGQGTDRFNLFGTTSATFPDIPHAPTINLLTDDQVPLYPPPISWTQVPDEGLQITAAMLKGTPIPSPSSPFTGFGLGQLTGDPDSGRLITNAVYIQLTGPLLKPFKVQITGQPNNGDLGLMGLAIYDKNLITTKVLTFFPVLQGDQSNANPNALQEIVLGGGDGGATTHSWLVDPVALTLTNLT